MRTKGPRAPEADPRRPGVGGTSFPVAAPVRDSVAPGATELRYLVLSDGTGPYLLARVRWPDVAQAISAGCPDWQEDVGLFDLPYDRSGVLVTPDDAAAIAAGWGAQLPAETAARDSGPRLIRRMPANWSDLSPAERRAWSLDSVTSGRRVGRTGSRLRAALTSVGSRLVRRPAAPAAGGRAPERREPVPVS
ncbi:MAG TPA: hypothetical protein VN796_01120 [Acidimicrobiales bacterium]|nr:hypothetical protein [Acidimicrobiales bacterium]